MSYRPVDPIWHELQREAAPDIRVLWDKKPRARKPHLCGACNDPIEVGEIYESRGYTEDGEFKAEKIHRWAYHYPSGCPRFRVRDAAREPAALSPAPAVQGETP